MDTDSILMTTIKSAREVFGNDITMMIARCPDWGHDDCCIIVNGAQHTTAAKSMASIIDGAEHQIVKSMRFGGGNYSYSTVTFPRNKE